MDNMNWTEIVTTMERWFDKAHADLLTVNLTDKNNRSITITLQDTEAENTVK